MIEAAKKPRTNFGKRSQMIPAPTAVSAPSRFSQKTTETTARIRHQMPIQMSRPITFIRVKVLIGSSGLSGGWPAGATMPPRSMAVDSSATTAKPAASANSEVPVQAPASPGEIMPGTMNLRTTERTRIMTIAHTETMAIEIAMWSFLALTAPPTAIEADTPHTAPAAPRTAPNCFSRPKSRVAAM